MFKRILVANRGEIAIRICRAAKELGITTVAIYSREDRFSLHRFIADESYQLDENKGPLEAYLDMDTLISIAIEHNIDAIHPGYGFLSENPDFVDKCTQNNITFIGPKSETMRTLGNKVSARMVAQKSGVPVVPASDALDISNPDALVKTAETIGYPLMIKASWGGGGRGMRPVESADALLKNVFDASAEAEKAFGNGEVYFEKMICRAKHVEVQLLGDLHGGLIHLFERDCSLQRRNQKIVERTPAVYLSDDRRTEICDLALKLGNAVGYENAGTVEFLMDEDSGNFYFIEVNPRVQVEHTITEVVTGVDIVKSQILIATGAKIGEEMIPLQKDVKLTGFALQCRLTTENPENNFIPDYGKITEYRSATGFGIRLDAGTAYSGARITPFYDSMLVKVTSFGGTAEESVSRMIRSLSEFRIRGVATNLDFLQNLLRHDSFLEGKYTTKFVDTTPVLLNFAKREDRLTKILKHIGNIAVNEHAQVTGRKTPETRHMRMPAVPAFKKQESLPKGTRDIFLEKGAKGFQQWILDQKAPMLTDTTMRDAHQSLFATRLRSIDLERIAPYYANMLPQLFSVECWGGATFDVSMRFLHECPWERLEKLRKKMPNQMLQMLLRSSNAVGYKNYPDNVVQDFIKRTADSGLDIFRVFDSLNWVENMKLSINAVLETGKICEGTVCYTGDIFDKNRPKYNLDYYVKMAQDLKSQGVHILGIKDMAGILKPFQARTLVKTLKEETGLPVHLHTHDTSGGSAMTLLSAIEAGADIVDCAMDSMSGTTSQPPLGTMVETMRHTEYEIDIPQDVLQKTSDYWAGVRELYSAFETGNKTGTAEVYLHEMPGGQFTNLKQQALSLGIDESRWGEVANMYAKVNLLFGDIVKVTPSSKVVGDLALLLVTAGVEPDEIFEKDISMPESVLSMLRGELGQPKDGWPVKLQERLLNSISVTTERPGKDLKPFDFDKIEQEMTAFMKRKPDVYERSSYMLYPEVFKEYFMYHKEFSDVTVLPTHTFFYGMQQGEEIEVTVEKGRTMIVKFFTVSDVNANGERYVFFEVNGSPRRIAVLDKTTQNTFTAVLKADMTNDAHLPAPMPGMITEVFVKSAEEVKKGQPLLTIEAMKMQTTVYAERDGVISKVHSNAGETISTQDLLLEWAA